MTTFTSTLLLALAILGTASSAELSAREQLANAVNAKKTTWKASAGGKFNKDAPLGAFKHLYGVKAGSQEAFDALAAVPGSDYAKADLVSAEVAQSLPDAFDSEANWPECAKVIGDIRDQSNCGCCWAFGAASAASDRLCIATNGTVAVPLSAEDVCFNAETNGCGGGTLFTPWSYIKRTGVVTGGQNLNDTAPTPSDPFYGAGFCSSFSLPHCHHHGDQGEDPYPAEGEPGCESQRSPSGPVRCDAESSQFSDFDADKFTFSGAVTTFPSDAATIQAAIMSDGPVEAAFTVYSDFETYSSGIYQHVSGSYEGGHAIRIVGWGTEDGTDYWKVANSWNPYWGENGYFRILRGSDECGIESQVTASAAGSSWTKKA
jgi:cathepsin B